MWLEEIEPEDSDNRQSLDREAPVSRETHRALDRATVSEEGGPFLRSLSPGVSRHNAAPPPPPALPQRPVRLPGRDPQHPASGRVAAPTRRDG